MQVKGKFRHSYTPGTGNVNGSKQDARILPPIPPQHRQLDPETFKALQEAFKLARQSSQAAYFAGFKEGVACGEAVPDDEIFALFADWMARFVEQHS